jgi:hypothetical protein
MLSRKEYIYILQFCFCQCIEHIYKYLEIVRKL